MARDDLYFRLRISADLKDRIKTSAVLNHRSITAEIIAALEGVFPELSQLETLMGRDGSLVAELLADVDQLRIKLQRLGSIGDEGSSDPE